MHRLKLSKEIDTGCDIEPYNLDSRDFTKKESEKLMSKSVVNQTLLAKNEIPPYEVSQRQMKKQKKLDREKTKGSDWYNMKIGDMNDQNKNDLTLIKMRAGLHKDSFFKANDNDNLPKYFEMGKIIDNPIDFYSKNRLTKRQQKNTILEELIQDAKVKKFTKAKYSILQAKEEKRRKTLLRAMKRRKKQKK